MLPDWLDKYAELIRWSLGVLPGLHSVLCKMWCGLFGRFSQQLLQILGIAPGRDLSLVIWQCLLLSQHTLPIHGKNWYGEEFLSFFFYVRQFAM